jgi:uncharacterized membrane protein YbhN (UPF0104 family)
MAEQPPRIEDVIAAAGQPGHAQCKAVLGAVSGWLVRQGDAAGLDIAGFRHVIDTSAVRHIKNRHGNEKTEQARGQIAISDGDILKIPLILSAPDQLIFGAQTPRRQPVIGYIKRLPDGALLFLQEVRAGRKHLSALSMRKYPAATLSGNIAATLESNGRTDGGTDIHIVDAPENVTAIEVNLPRDEIAAAIMNKHPATRDAGGIAANVRLYGRTDSGDAVDIADLPENIMATEPPPKPAWRRVIKFLPPVLGVLVLAGIIFGLHGALSRVSPRDVLDALAATSARQIYEAFGLLGVSFCIMMLYDWPGIFFAKKLISFPPIGGKHVALASFSAYALSHVLGAPAISGAAIRLRLYAEWRVPPSGIARIITLSGSTFALGAATLIGGILLLQPRALPLFGDVSAPALRLAGAVILAVIIFYIILAGRPGQRLALFGRQIPLPGSLLAVSQLALSCADISVAGAILYMILPAAPGLGLSHVLAIYLAAFAGGLFSSLPAGIGVFDTVLLLALSPYLDPAVAIGAILLFRVLYFLIPASVAALCFAAHEIFLTTKGQTQ